MGDICLNCGKEHGNELWGALCNCNKPNVVHQKQCDGCKKIIGYIIDDDYCGPEKLYCPQCVDSSKQLATPATDGRG